MLETDSPPPQLGWTVLHHAARNGDLEICKQLITHDCKPGTENKVGVFVLCVCVCCVCVYVCVCVLCVCV